METINLYPSLVLGFALTTLGRAATPIQASGAKTPSADARKLVTGKLIYIAPMPDNLDQWIIEDLRVWGKYKVTGNSEGVDLVLRAEMPEERTRYAVRGGVPRPQKEHSKPPAPSIQVVDWVAGRTLWDAEIVNKKPKTDEPEPPAGPHTQIFAHGLTTDQLAVKIIRELRRYVEGLEKGTGSKQ